MNPFLPVRLIIGLLLGLAGLAASATAAEIRISVAASMTDALKALKGVYEARVPGVTILPNFGSSGTLAKQISQGAPADLFISANPEWMSFLVEEGRVPADRVRPLAYNSLVFVGRPGVTVASLEDVAGLRRVAIGSPKSVPAGQYAVQALQAAGLYDQIRGKLVRAKDVRQALVYADRGETDGAFVYRTDALLARDAVILLEVPERLYDEVAYLAGMTNAGAAKAEAVAFHAFLGSAVAGDVLRQYGFVVR